MQPNWLLRKFIQTSSNDEVSLVKSMASASFQADCRRTCCNDAAGATHYAHVRDLVYPPALQVGGETLNTASFPLRPQFFFVLPLQTRQILLMVWCATQTSSQSCWSLLKQMAAKLERSVSWMSLMSQAKNTVVLMLYVKNHVLVSL